MDNNKAEDIFMDRIIEINQLWNSIRELLYIHMNLHLDVEIRDKEAKRNFALALIKLEIIKPLRKRKSHERKTRPQT